MHVFKDRTENDVRKRKWLVKGFGIESPCTGSDELLLDLGIQKVQECHEVEDSTADSADDHEDVRREHSEDTCDCEECEQDDQQDPDDGIHEGLLVVGDYPSNKEDDDTEDDGSKVECQDCRDTGSEDETGECSELGTGSLGEGEADDSAIGLHIDCDTSKDHDGRGQDGTDGTESESSVNHCEDSEDYIDDRKDRDHESEVFGVVKELHVFTRLM